MSGFANSILGGMSNLIRAAIRSPNYAAGSAGWSINKDGSAELNNATIRGTITAGVFAGTNFEINSSGAFFYSGTPAAGNLLASIAPAAGTDAYANAYAQGFGMYGGTGKPYIQIAIQGSGATAVPAFFLNPNVANATAAAITLGVINSGLASEYAETFWNGPSVTGQVDEVNIGMVSSAQNASSASAGNLYYTDILGILRSYLGWTYSGAALTGTVTAAQPGTGTSTSNPAVPEAFHSMSGLLVNGFSSGTPTPEYRLLPHGKAEITGAVILPGGTSAYNAVTLATLPAGYAPSNIRRWPVLPLAGTTYGNSSFPGAARGVLQAGSGAIQLSGIPGSLNGQSVDISGEYPL